MKQSRARLESVSEVTKKNATYADKRTVRLSADVHISVVLHGVRTQLAWVCEAEFAYPLQIDYVRLGSGWEQGHSRPVVLGCCQARGRAVA